MNGHVNVKLELSVHFMSMFLGRRFWKQYQLLFISVFNQLDAQNLFRNKCYFYCDDTRGYVIQFWPPDDEHMCSKHVEAWNKTYCETNFVHRVC